HCIVSLSYATLLQPPRAPLFPYTTLFRSQVLIRLTLKNPIADAPGSFTIANPPRIAFDFPDTTNGLGRNSQDIGEAVLRSMNVVDRKSTRLNSSHEWISYAVFCLKKKKDE